MMLRHLGAKKGADAIEAAVRKVLVKGYRTLDIAPKDRAGVMLVGTREMGDAVLAAIG